VRFSPPGFSQVRLLVDDPAEAFRFYRDELGLMPGWDEEGDAHDSLAAGDGAGRIASRVAAGPTERPDWGGRVLHLRDPSGNLVELFESIPREGE